MIEDWNVKDSPKTKLNVKPFSFANTILAELLLCDKNRKNIKFGWLSWVGQNWAFFDSSTFLVLDFFFLSDAGWFSIEEAILGLDAEDAKEARARSWQVGGVGLVTFYLPWTLWLGLVVFLDIIVGMYYGLFWFNASSLNAPPSFFLTNKQESW